MLNDLMLRILGTVVRPLALAGLSLVVLAGAWAGHRVLAERALARALDARVVQAEQAARAAVLAETARILSAERAAANLLRRRLAEAEAARDAARIESEDYADARRHPPADCRVDADLLRRLRG